MDTALEFAITPDSMNPFSFDIGDTLNQHTCWKKSKPYLGPRANVGHETLNATLILLENREFEFQNEYADYWNAKRGYIGFRRKDPADSYSYGWMKIGLASYHEFTLYEYYFYNGQ